MKNIQKTLRTYLCITVLMFSGICTFSQDFSLHFGHGMELSNITSGSFEKGIPLKWINVNTTEETWSIKEKDLLICSGQPIGVMRSEKQYENYIFHIEWKFMERGGNAGVFMWSSAIPPENKRLPDGVEVQMLELDYFKVNPRDNISNPESYVHGHLFGVGGTKTIPDNPMGNRSNSLEHRCYGKGIWNTYVVVCVDGVIKLSVNGKFVNGISQASQKKGYICLESEGAEIHFRNIRIIELPPGVTSHEQIAPLL